MVWTTNIHCNGRSDQINLSLQNKLKFRVHISSWHNKVAGPGFVFLEFFFFFFFNSWPVLGSNKNTWPKAIGRLISEYVSHRLVKLTSKYMYMNTGIACEITPVSKSLQE